VQDSHPELDSALATSLDSFSEIAEGSVWKTIK
jgi:hypothetical protein